MRLRCGWAKLSVPEYVRYHDEEWGVLVKDDRKLFEMLILEGAQAGLSWETVLKRRPAYLKAFDNFEPKIVAGYSEEKILELIQDEGIIRNRLKIRSAVNNAQKFLEVQKEFGSFYKYLMAQVGGKVIVNHWETLSQIPPRTELSDKISKDLKKRGFNFVGSTIIYAFMQAVGLVDDHLIGCFKRKGHKIDVK
jgi:DNA-3-methyladenine glycosylase I